MRRDRSAVVSECRSRRAMNLRIRTYDSVTSRSKISRRNLLPCPAPRGYSSGSRITEGFLMNTVKELLQEKGSAVWTVAPSVTVYEALQLMAEKNIGAVVVIDGGNVVGMFTERDYARKVVLAGRSSKTTKVSELMIQDVLYVSPDDTIENC